MNPLYIVFWKARKHGLSLTSIWVLLILQENRHGITTTGTMAKRVGLTCASMTGVADVLEGRGYINRIQGDLDRRTVGLSITDKGLSIFESMEVAA